MGMKINIAIDGFSSCGKSTLARQLADKLQYAYIDTGSMYRAITLYFIRENVRLDDAEEVVKALSNIELEFRRDHQNNNVIFLNGEHVSSYIRDLLVADKVSIVAANKAVREFAVRQQKALGKGKGVIMDGRDIGTVVMPDAELKIFVTADPEIRVKRRYLEMIATDPNVHIEDVKKNLEMRDFIDTNREEGPLLRAEDARLLDNSDMNREEQLDVVMKWVQEAISNSKKISQV